jgi:hypothetical protein
MRNFKKIFFLSVCIIGQALADVGCMDNSKHVKDMKNGYDYKTLHYVECSCPCQKQRHLIRKGKCFKCRHYIKLDAVAFDMNFLYETYTDSIFGKVFPYKYF